MPVIPIFVSSTFRDFHAERDCLMTDVRPRLDEQIVPLGCRVELIDLRWGIEAEDEARMQQRVLDVCLSEVDRADPMFIALLGDRYGWCPPPGRLAEVAQRSGLDPQEVEGASVTALEVERGVLRRAPGGACVLHRDLVGDAPPGWRDGDRTAIADLRRRTHAAEGVPIRRYRAEIVDGRLAPASRATFEEIAFDLLAPLVVARARQAGDAAVDPYATAEAMFVEDRTAVLAARGPLVSELVVRVLDGGQAVCLHGPSGVGKSAIWCAVVDELRRSGATVASVVVGVVPGTTSERDVVDRLLTTLGEPADDEDEDGARAHLARVVRERDVVVAIDGLDGLDPGPDRDRLRTLTALDGARVVTTTTSDAQRRVLEGASHQVLAVAELDPDGVRAMVAGLAAESRRDLPAAVQEDLASAARSPLWVRLAFDELIGLDEQDFDGLAPGSEPVAALLAATVASFPPQVERLADRSQVRCAARYGDDLTGWVYGLLAVSRSGLAPLDLARLSGGSTLDVAGIRRRSGGSIRAQGTDGRLGFGHGILRRAAHDRIAAAEGGFHSALAEHLSGVDDRAAAVVGDRWYHALLADDGRHALALVGGGPPGDGSGDVVSGAIADALRTDRGLVALHRMADALDGTGLETLLWWLETAPAGRLDAGRRRDVTGIAAQVASRLQPQVLRARDIVLSRAARPTRGYADHTMALLDPAVRAAERRRARALRLDATARAAAGEKRLASVRQLGRARAALVHMVQLIDELERLERDGSLTAALLPPPDHPPIPPRERVELLEEVEAVDRDLTAVEIASDTPSSSKLDTMATRQAEVAEQLVAGGGDAGRAASAELRALVLRVEAASRDDRHDEALALVDQLVERAEARREAAPGEWSAAVAAAGTACGRAGDRTRAAALAQRYETAAREALRLDPGGHGPLLDLLTGLHLVLAREGDGRAPDDPDRKQEYLARSRAAVAADPASATAQRHLARALEHVGDDLGEAGDHVASRDAYREGRDIQKELQRLGHSDDLGELLVLTRKWTEVRARASTGRIGRAMGDLDETRAQKAAAPALKARRKARRRAKRALDAGDARTAVDAAAQAVRCDRERLDLLAAWPEEVTVDLVDSLHTAGQAHHLAGDVPAARTAFAEAADLLRPVRAAQPRDLLLTIRSANCLSNLGQLCEDDPPRATAVWREAVEVDRVWVEIQARNQHAHVALCTALTNLRLLVRDAPEEREVLEDLVTRLPVVADRWDPDAELPLWSALLRVAELTVRSDPGRALAAAVAVVDRAETHRDLARSETGRVLVRTAAEGGAQLAASAGDPALAERLRQAFP